MIKKADIILFFIILIFGLAVSWFTLTSGAEGEKVRIIQDGNEYGTYSLHDDREIEVKANDHTNHITIKDGQVSMSYSSCKNQVCVNSGAISQTNDSIVCLPNKVVVEIIGDSNNEGGDADVIAD